MAFKFNEYHLGGAGGMGTDSTVIDVESLPTENIDDSKIYRTMSETDILLWVAGSMDGEEISMSLTDMFAQSGVNASVSIHIVETMPESEEMEPVDLVAYSLPCYVVESTGIAYVFVQQGSTSMVLTFGQMIGGADGGWVDSVDDIVVPDTQTIYIVRPGKQVSYGIPNDDKSIYQYNGSWKNITDELKSLSNTNVLLNTTVNNLTQEKDRLTQERDELKPYAEFGKYAVLEGTTNAGVRLVRVGYPFGEELSAQVIHVQKIKIPDYVTHIGMTNPPNYTEFSKYDIFNGVVPHAIEFPTNLKVIEQYALQFLQDIEEIVIHSVEEIRDYAFYYSYFKSIVLPNNLVSIGNSAFNMCAKLESITIPESVKTIGAAAFYVNSNTTSRLTNVTFNGKPTSIGTNAFEGCTNLTDIYVPWAEGEVAGTPWGATNAIVHYNHTA